MLNPRVKSMGNRMALFVRFHKWLITPAPPTVNAKTGVWWGLSLAITVLFAVLALHQGFSGDRIVQDDARQYLFWMQRFQDASLFPNDLIADYFRSVTPLGYIALYRLGALLGIDPFTFNKLLPIALALITTGYFFWLVIALIPLPPTAFLSTLLLNQTLWMKDDLVSATPRAFVYPCFIAFLYYLTRPLHHLPPPSPDHSIPRSSIPGTLSLLLLGLFYPQYVLIAAGIVILSLVHWHHGKLTLSRRAVDWWRMGIYLTTIVAVITFYGLTASDYDPVVTLEQAKAMPEFWPGGRNFFFSENLWWFYAVGDRSGFLNVGLVRPATLALGIFLPLLLWRSPHHPVIKALTPQSPLLLRFLISATTLFLFSHLLLFQLHLPSRYTDHSLRIIMAIAAALVLTITLEFLTRPRARHLMTRPLAHSLTPSLPHCLTALVLTGLILCYPLFVENFPLTKYKQGRAPRLYTFFQEQPVDSLVASVAEDVNNIPIFAQRSILVGREYAIPYHLGYYNEFHDRAVALIRAQYSADPEVAIAFIESYGIDYWIIDEKAYDPDYIVDNWTRQYWSEVEDVVTAAIQGATPALIKGIRACEVARQKPLSVLDTDCLIRILH